jgi:hypothetical protein
MSPFRDADGQLRPIPFPPMPDDGQTIAWRATKVQALLETYYQMHLGYSRQEALNDLITDLRHFDWWHADDARDPTDFEAALDSSVEHFCEEHWEEDPASFAHPHPDRNIRTPPAPRRSMPPADEDEDAP